MWLVVFWSDPGKISHQNAADWLAAEPPGDRVYPIKSCATCGIQKPARSKHCSLCKHCIARNDHHCTPLLQLPPFRLPFKLFPFVSFGSFVRTPGAHSPVQVSFIKFLAAWLASTVLSDHAALQVHGWPTASVP
jgi:hypothetical protein